MPRGIALVGDGVIVIAPPEITFWRDTDGDGKADIAVWRGAEGRWYIQQSSNGETRAVVQGRPGDQPVPVVPRI